MPPRMPPSARPRLRWLPLLPAAGALLLAGAPAAARAQSPSPCVVSPRPDAAAPDAIALPTPYQAYVQVGGTCRSMSGGITGTGKVRTLTFSEVIDGSQISVQAVFDADPFVNFVVGVVNGSGVTQSYAFSFTTPVIGGPYNLATSSGGVTVTLGGGSSSQASLHPAFSNYIRGFVNGLSTNLGVDIGTAQCTTVGSTTCTQPAGAATFGPLTPADLTGQLAFQLTGDQSVAGWTGRVEIAASVVPEPATVTLLAAGVVLTGALAARRRTT